MRCFNHPKSEAIGICSSCNKGVCQRCAVEKDGKVYCRDCISRQESQSTKCYNHPRSEAVGVCSSCKRPICTECAIEKDGRLYCRSCSAELPKAFEPLRRAEEIIPIRREKPIPRATVELTVQLSECVSSTISGGIIGGFLMGLPFINLLLIWSAVGGFVAVYLLKLRVDRFGNGYIRNKDALIVGGASGAVAAFVATVFNIIYAVLLKNFLMDAGLVLESWGMNAGMVDVIIKLSVTDLSLSLPFIFVKLVLTIMLFALLGAVGGALSSELSKR